MIEIQIKSHSRPIEHTVTFENNEWHCTCEHHIYRHTICKHIKEAQRKIDEKLNPEKPQGLGALFEEVITWNIQLKNVILKKNKLKTIKNY